MLRPFVVASLTLLACSKSPSGLTDAGSGTGGSGLCTPDKNFCNGTKLYTCTRSGLDAIGGTDCATLGTPTNPGSCSNGACVRAQPTCSWSFTTPSTSGTNCETPLTCTAGPFSTGFIDGAPTACPPLYPNPSVQLSITRPLTAGHVYTLPDSNVSLTFAGPSYSPTCVAWTGTITLDSDLPAWHVTLNATCSTNGAVQLVGTMSGQL